MATIKDVAKKAGVSISTVSNFINGTKPVSKELSTRIMEAIRELGYEVDPVARSLKSKISNTIGVIITNINRIFFPQVIKGIQDTALKYGYKLTLCNTNDDFEKEKEFVQMLKSNWVDGIILDTIAEEENSEYFKMLSTLRNGKKRIAVVSLERKIAYPNIDSIVVDNYYGGYLATQHLVECGCNNIVHITGPMCSSMARDRLNGYKKCLSEKGIQIDDKNIVEGDFSPLSGYDAIKKLLISGVNFEGVFAANDQMAIGAIKAIKEHGYRIPEDIKVVGFDNTFVASIVDPSLTTIDVPKYRMGVEAMERLMFKINKNDACCESIELPIRLIVRQSTDLRGEKNWDLYGW